MYLLSVVFSYILYFPLLNLFYAVSESIFSFLKVKTDKVLIMLKKKSTGKTWAYVTDRDKKEKDKNK